MSMTIDQEGRDHTVTLIIEVVVGQGHILLNHGLQMKACPLTSISSPAPEISYQRLKVCEIS